jgi:hypothetical protein
MSATASDVTVGLVGIGVGVDVGSAVAVGWSVGFSVGGGSVGVGGGRVNVAVGFAVGACVGSVGGETVTAGSASACIVGFSASPPMLQPTTSIKTRANVINLFRLFTFLLLTAASKRAVFAEKETRQECCLSFSITLPGAVEMVNTTFLLI